MLRAFATSAAGILSRCLLLLATTTALSVSPDAQSGRPRPVRIDDALRREGEALVAMADARARGERVPSDFAIEWRNDFFKARPGTFVPFTLSFPASALADGPALLYVRVQASRPVERRGTKTPAEYAYETIFPVRIEHRPGEDRFRLRRGFAVPPGSYRVTVVLRGPAGAPGRGTSAAFFERSLEVPDFWTSQLATSTLILAERIEPLASPVPADELDEDPYAVGSHRIHPAATATYNRQAELVVVFLVYNPTVTPERQFDVQVDYHLFREIQRGDPRPAGSREDGPDARPGEYYVTRTSPQRFNPAMMGPQFDPSSGAPVLAGQAIPLGTFDPGTYRMNVVVTDLLSQRTLSRDVTFTVVGS